MTGPRFVGNGAWDDDDYDLSACLEYNPQADFRYADIESVVAQVEGEGDSTDWFWILKLRNGQYAYLQGGCDYTGWDCQSWATSVVAETPYKLFESVPQDAYYKSQQESLLQQIVDGSLRSIRALVGDALKAEEQPPKGPPRRLIRKPRRADF